MAAVADVMVTGDVEGAVTNYVESRTDNIGI